MFQHFIEFSKRSNIRRYTENISWMFFARVFTMAVSFLTMLYVARNLGPTNFGELDYALAIIGLFGVIGSWGIEGVLNRELIKHPEDHNDLVGTAILLRLVFGMTSTVLIIVFAFFSPADYLSKILLILLSFTHTISTLSILQQIFFARAESKYPSLITISVTLVINIAKVFILLSDKGLIYLAASLVFESILVSTLSLLVYKHVLRRKISSWTFSASSAHLMLKTGSAVAFLGIFAMIYSRIDQIMIRHLLDATSVGLYSAGVRIVEVWMFIPGILGAGLYPAVLSARKISESLYHTKLRLLLMLYMLPAILLAAIVSIGAKPLIMVIYGEQFIEGFHSLQVYAWSLPGTFIGFFVMNILFTDDYRKILVFTSAFPALLNVVLNLALIPTSGIIGAAWATVISYSLIPFIPLLFKSSRAALYAVYKT